MTKKTELEKDKGIDENKSKDEIKKNKKNIEINEYEEEGYE